MFDQKSKVLQNSWNFSINMLIVQAFKIKNKIGGSTLKFFSYGAPKGAFYIKFGRKTSFFFKKYFLYYNLSKIYRYSEDYHSPLI